MTTLGVILVALGAMLVLAAVRGDDIRDVLRETITGARP